MEFEQHTSIPLYAGSILTVSHLNVPLLKVSSDICFSLHKGMFMPLLISKNKAQ